MAYECQCNGVFYEAIMLSRKHLKFKKSELGRRDGITSEILLSKSFLKMHLKVPNNGVRRSAFSVLKLQLVVFVFSHFIPIRTSLELQNLLFFCYFLIFKILC